MRETIFLHRQGEADSQVEMLVEHPPGDGLRPAVMLMHGHQEPPDQPGAGWAFEGTHRAVLEAGYVVAAVSMPGYGRSDGPPDFCGPRSQAAVRTGLAHLRTLPSVDCGRIAMCGWSRGAVISALVATEEPGLRALVLAKGIYDFFHPHAFMVDGMESAFIEEAGASGDDEKRARSAAAHAERLLPPTLFLHGSKDDRAHIDQAVAFHKRLVALGRSSRMVIYPDADHVLPPDHLRSEIIPFLKEMLG